MNGKTFAVFSSLLLLIGGVTAYQFTGTVETNFDALLEDTSDGEWQCVVMNSYFLPECSKPINIEVGGATTTEVKWSIANSGAVATDNREQALGDINKRLDSSFGIAMAEAKQEGIEDLNAGASSAIATSNSSDVIRDWYAKIQRNALNYRNREVLKLNASYNEAQKAGTQSLYFKGTKNDHIAGLKIHEKNLTLYDGQNMTAYFVEAKVPYEKCSDTSTGYTWKNLTSQETVALDYWGSDCETENVETDLYAEDPEGNLVMFHSPDNYMEIENSITSTKDRAISNTRDLVENIFSTYSQGEVNVSSSLGPLEVLKTASTSYSSTGYYDYATLTAKQMGLETNDSYAFEINWSQEGSNETYKDVGQLFLDDTAFNGTLETGKQYNVTDQTVWFTHTASNGDIVQEELNGTFTVLEMTNKESGKTVNSTSTQDIQVYESNITDLEKQLQNLEEQLEEYQTPETGGTGAGGSMSGLFGLSAGQTGIVAVFLVMTTFIAGAVAT